MSRIHRKPWAFFCLLLLLTSWTTIATAQSNQSQGICEYQANKSPEMVVIDSGFSQMGSPKSEVSREANEGPQHEVTIVKPFALGRCEVTLAEFRIFIEQSGYKTGAEKAKGCSGWDSEKKNFEQNSAYFWKNPGFVQKDNEPVSCISSQDAQAYIIWLNQRSGQTYRLPSEAEWDYAARAGTNTTFSTGDCINTEQANYNGTTDYNKCGAKTDVYRQKTMPVDELPPNPWGLQHMHGNVYEWTQDCWHENYKGAPNDGSAWQDGDKGDCTRRVVRGGGWISKPQNLRSAIRLGVNADVAIFYVGFRLARDL